ncbi:MAG TPA: amino acid racemase [Patescibacteria group bacterium]
MINKQHKKIGIIDGMGAFAGARFFQDLLIKITANNMVIPEIILDAISIDDFISDPSKILPAKRIIGTRIRNFNRQKVSFVVMACNTAHIIHPDLSVISMAPFPSIIDLVVNQAKIKHLKNIGILASPTTLKTRLYEDELLKFGLMPFIPNNSFQHFLEKIIRNVISNQLTSDDVQTLTAVSRDFVNENNLDGLILGCTELPLAFSKSSFSDITILDSLDILADSVIAHLKC